MSGGADAMRGGGGEPGDGGLRLLPCGAATVLVEVDSTTQAMALHAASSTLPPALQVVDVVPGARTVLFDGVSDLDALRSWLDRWRRTSPPDGVSLGATGIRTVEVPTRYDGADLEDVARRWGMTREEAVATHAGLAFTVAFCGFAPGFAYCTGLPPELALPRLTEPRPRVPAGSVGVADGFTGVYPAASPGGWRLLGRTALTLWDPTAPDPAVLSPGTGVRFVPVTDAR